jgi:predicted amidohydrolase
VLAKGDAPGGNHYFGFGDVDGDGRGDVCIGAKGETFTGGNWFAWWKRPQDARQVWQKQLIAENQIGATNIQPGDLNGDGVVDFFATRGHGQGVVWFEGPNWKPHEVDPTLDGPHCLQVYDIDGDGDLDAATCAKLSKLAVWYENDGRGHFKPRVVGKDQAAYDIRILDMDGDGDVDFLIAGQYSANIVWYENPLIRGAAETGSAARSAKSLTVAVVSPRCVFGDVRENLNHFASLIEEAAAKGARLVCFPELALTSYSTDAAILQSAEEIPGPVTKELESLAKRLGVYISVGMAERDGPRHHIAQVLVGPSGYLGKYRKHHPTGPEQSCGFAPGEAFPTWDIDGFRFGILICFDGRHQDTIEAMKNAHVDVIHHPHGNVVGNLGRDAEEWTRSKMVYFVPRAVGARAYILVNNSAEDAQQPRGTLQYSSGALVLDPLGQVVSRTMQMNRQEKMIIATLQRPEAIIPPGELRQLQTDPVFKARFGAREK